MNKNLQRQKLLPKYHNHYHCLNTKMTIALCCRDYSSAQDEKVPKTIMTKQRMRCKHEKMCYFHLTKVGDRMPSTEINCLRQHMKIHVLKLNLLKPRLTLYGHSRALVSASVH